MSQMTTSEEQGLSGLSAALNAQCSALETEMRPVFERFADALFARLKASGTTTLSSDFLARLATETFRHLRQRQAGKPAILVERLALLPTTGAKDAPQVARAYSVVATINDDKSFLVSSVVGEVQAKGLRSQLVLHPIYDALRDEAGMLRDICLASAGESKAGTIDAEKRGAWRRESVIVIVMDALEPEPEHELAVAIESVLSEVDMVVADRQAMLERLDETVKALAMHAVMVPANLLSETIAFCQWLREGQFVFLGMREYRIDGSPETGKLSVVEGSGLGILSDPQVHVLRRGRELVALNDEVRRFYLRPQPIIITKSNVVSRVHRRVHMDYVGLKTYGDDGRLAGELRIVGLFTSAAYTQLPADIPLLRLKVDRVFAVSGIPRSSHEGRMLQNILDTFPRDELIQIGAEQLASWAPSLLQLEFDPRVRVFARRDKFDRFVSVLTFVPRDRFSTDVRERIGEMLAELYNGRVVAFQPYFTAGPLVRVSYIIGRYEGATPKVAVEAIESRIEDIIQTWEDRLDERLARLPDGLSRYANAFPAGYADTFSPDRALEDIERIGRLSEEGPVAIDFYRSAETGEAEAHAAVYRFDHPIPLSERVPLLERLGFSVIDERTYQVKPRINGGERTVCLHDMIVRTADGRPFDLERVDLRLEDAFTSVFSGVAANDFFNHLVLRADLDWREAALLRAYAGYMRQIGLPFEQRYIAGTLVRHAERAGDLVRLFKARFDPDVDASLDERQRVEDDLTASFRAHLAEVPSLDEDRILRTLLGLVQATVRTNFFQRTGEGGPPRSIALKLSSADVADAPQPRPYREVFVSSTEVDGVHLRFAPIARGGLRWSDRAQDFRTEVLGLAKAQQVKNTVIVPQGAKGGFVPKHLPEGGGREEMMRVGISAYRLFVSSLLDITDNLVGGKLVPPDRVVRRDSDDPYLVVAADKGTATFSDFANEISAEHGFWLDDAFASGGSAGYDHKKMGITARGAWECVKRHFREMDHDIQITPFRVVGVGDMSGDVFGNGMLLSPAIKLVAAFDHRDIFIDPQPDPGTSYAERKRIFELPRSSWQDYDRSLISAGGGVFPRSAKAIEVTPQMRECLGLEAATVAPAELIRAILKASVDLMWFGGIGTYVRGDEETNADVGDRGNDQIRIKASELGARVVGEGANLGLTQRARIDFAARGGRINTDFIDNSAGVNSSDQEVNIKIALAPALAGGRLDRAARNALLVTMTDDVAEACLENNEAQSLAISLAERRGEEGIADAMHLMHQLEQRGMLDRGLEVLPEDAALRQRRQMGRGLTRPELAVLLSYSKLALSYDIIASSIPDDPAVAPALQAYFPSALREHYASDIAAHPLRREIITTGVTNRIVNLAGADLPSRLVTDWDLDVEGMGRCALAAIEVLDADRLFADIAALDNKIAGEQQLGLYAEVQELVRSRAGWFGANARHVGELDATIRRHTVVYGQLAASIDDLLTPPRRDRFSAHLEQLVTGGAPQQLAQRIATARALRESSDIALVADAAASPGIPIERVAKAYFAIGDALHLSALREAARDVEVSDRYDRLAINSAVSSLAGSHRTATSKALDFAPSAASTNGSGGTGVEQWWEHSAGLLDRGASRLSGLIDGGAVSIARLTVAAAQVRELADAT